MNERLVPVSLVISNGVPTRDSRKEYLSLPIIWVNSTDEARNIVQKMLPGYDVSYCSGAESLRPHTSIGYVLVSNVPNIDKTFHEKIRNTWLNNCKFNMDRGGLNIITFTLNESLPFKHIFAFTKPGNFVDLSYLSFISSLADDNIYMMISNVPNTEHPCTCYKINIDMTHADTQSVESEILTYTSRLDGIAGWVDDYLEQYPYNYRHLYIRKELEQKNHTRSSQSEVRRIEVSEPESKSVSEPLKPKYSDIIDIPPVTKDKKNEVFYSVKVATTGQRIKMESAIQHYRLTDKQAADFDKNEIFKWLAFGLGDEISVVSQKMGPYTDILHLTSTEKFLTSSHIEKCIALLDIIFEKVKEETLEHID